MWRIGSERVVPMQPFLRSFLAGVLAATTMGLGLLVTLLVLATGEHELYDALLSPGAVVLFLVGTPLTAALVGLVVARHADGRLRALGSGLLAGVTGQFIFLILFALALSVSSAGTAGGLVPAADDGVSAEEFTVALLSLIPAGFTAALVGLAASGPPAGAAGAYALPRRDDAPDLDAGNMDAVPDADLSDVEEPAPAPTPRQLTCPRCHTVNEVPPGGGRITCKECGLAGRAA